jgi:hypothetical protein
VGGSFHVRAGEIFFPIQEYFAGMDCPFVNASLVSSRDIVASGEGDSDAADSVIVDVTGVGVREDAQDATTTLSMIDITQMKIINLISFLFVRSGTAK